MMTRDGPGLVVASAVQEDAVVLVVDDGQGSRDEAVGSGCVGSLD